MKLDSVDERVLVYRSGVRGTLTQCLTVELAGEPDVLLGNRREWDELDGFDLDLAEPDPVTAALLTRGRFHNLTESVISPPRTSLRSSRLNSTPQR